MKDTAILGIGNILLRDDGVGVHTIKELEKENLPSTIELVDAGTSTLDMLSYFTDFSKIIVIDSLKAGNAPGTIYKINPDQIKDYQKGNLSIHDVQILDVVKMANMLGHFPNVVIFGIEPEEIRFELDMSDTMKSSMPILVNHVKKELGIN